MVVLAAVAVAVGLLDCWIVVVVVLAAVAVGLLDCVKFANDGGMMVNDGVVVVVLAAVAVAVVVVAVDFCGFVWIFVHFC